MGKYCEVCNKGVMSGNMVSHSNRKTKRSWAPNVQKVRVVVNGTPRRMNVGVQTCALPISFVQIRLSAVSKVLFHYFICGANIA